jgi:hypothetical protein
VYISDIKCDYPLINGQFFRVVNVIQSDTLPKFQTKKENSKFKTFALGLGIVMNDNLCFAGLSI